jgi:hypothetical protein
VAVMRFCGDLIFLRFFPFIFVQKSALIYTMGMDVDPKKARAKLFFRFFWRIFESDQQLWTLVVEKKVFGQI